MAIEREDSAWSVFTVSVFGAGLASVIVSPGRRDALTPDWREGVASDSNNGGAEYTACPNHSKPRRPSSIDPVADDRPVDTGAGLNRSRRQ